MYLISEQKDLLYNVEAKVVHSMLYSTFFDEFILTWLPGQCARGWDQTRKRCCFNSHSRLELFRVRIFSTEMTCEHELLSHVLLGATELHHTGLARSCQWDTGLQKHDRSLLFFSTTPPYCLCISLLS